MRIIPARAGFTSGRSTTSPSTTDHPRSRGVYCSLYAHESSRSGSSPLARGLLRQTYHPRGGGGIIPARAGFTQQRHRLAGAVTRIIPARAGFTHPMTSTSSVPKDHPRSRGVYLPFRYYIVIQPGSSPLARGLRKVVRAKTKSAGIIPARAGFTARASWRTSRAWDHPRSRGVYLTGNLTSATDVGSSPLARGLRPGDRARAARGGIIPARAGFTERLTHNPYPR